MSDTATQQQSKEGFVTLNVNLTELIYKFSQPLVQSVCWKDKQAWQNNPLNSLRKLIRLILSKRTSVIFFLTHLML